MPALEPSLPRAGMPRRQLMAGALMLLAAGCNNSSGRSIPIGAVDMAGGKSPSFVAPADGTIWIYDKERDHVVYQGRVLAGDRVSVNAAADRVQIAGQSVNLKSEHLVRKDRYRIYFKK